MSRRDFLLALGGDLERGLALGLSFIPDRTRHANRIQSSAADGMFGVDLNQSLFVDVYSGKLEVKPAAEELLVARAVLEIGTGCPMDGGVADARLE